MKKNRLFILPVFAALALSLADARAATLFPVVVGDTGDLRTSPAAS